MFAIVRSKWLPDTLSTSRARTTLMRQARFYLLPVYPAFDLCNSDDDAQIYREITDHLAHGGNPNQIDYAGYSAMHYFFHQFSGEFLIKITSRLLQYGFDMNCANAWDYVRSSNPQKAFFLTSKLIPPIQSIPTKKNCTVDISFINTPPSLKVITQFTYPEMQLHSCLQKVDTLSEKERISIQSLAAEFFERTDVPSIPTLFHQELQDSNTLIEQIFYQNQLIGFVVLKLHFPCADQQKHIVIEYPWSVMHVPYQKLGLIYLLSWRTAFALQRILPQYKIDATYIAISRSSHRLVDDFLYFPKYQSPHIEDLVKELLAQMYPESAAYYRQQLECHILEPTTIKSTHKPQPQRSYQEQLYQEMRGVHRQSAIPILFPACMENYQAFLKKIISMGYTKEHHIQRFSMFLFLFLLPQYLNQIKKQTPSSANNAYYFFNKEIIPTQPDTMNHSALAKL